MSLEIGNKLDNRFLLTKKLQEGGMGDIYLAFDEKTKRACVAKILKDGLDDKLFSHETEIAISLSAIDPSSFPEIIAVLTATRNQCAAMIMEYIDGIDLKDMLYINGGSLSPSQAVKMALKILVCLKITHQQGIVIRDVKPENILISRSGAVKLTDFGLSKSNRPESQICSGGSPEYTAPEIWNREPYDHRSDLYSLGILLYEILQGKESFVAKDDTWPSRLSLEDDHLSHPPPPMRTDIPKPLQNIVLKLLAKNPEDRFQTAQEVARSLAEYEIEQNPDLCIEEPYYSALGCVTEK